MFCRPVFLVSSRFHIWGQIALVVLAGLLMGGACGSVVCHKETCIDLAGLCYASDETLMALSLYAIVRYNRI